MTTTTYTNKSNAVRAARRELGADATPGADFHLVASGDEWGWAAGAAPTPEADKRSPRMKKADAEAQAEGFPNATRRAEVKRAAGERAKVAAPKAEKAPTKKGAAQAAAERGELPEAPDFSKPTHARFRKTLDQLVALAAAGDVKGLKAVEINPISSSRTAMFRYRELCVVALEAKAKAA